MSPESTLLEAETRKAIDAKLDVAGWAVQDKSRINLYEKLGVAVREMDTDSGPADNMLFIQNAEMPVDDFNYISFNQKDRLLKARELFGKDLQPIIDELNGFLIT